MFQLEQDLNLTAPMLPTLVNISGISFLSFDRCVYQGLFGTHEDGIELAAKWLRERGSLRYFEFYGGDACGTLTYSPPASQLATSSS